MVKNWELELMEKIKQKKNIWVKGSLCETPPCSHLLPAPIPFQQRVLSNKKKKKKKKKKRLHYRVKQFNVMCPGCKMASHKKKKKKKKKSWFSISSSFFFKTHGARNIRNCIWEKGDQLLSRKKERKKKKKRLEIKQQFIPFKFKVKAYLSNFKAPL